MGITRQTMKQGTEIYSRHFHPSKQPWDGDEGSQLLALGEVGPRKPLSAQGKAVRPAVCNPQGGLGWRCSGPPQPLSTVQHSDNHHSIQPLRNTYNTHDTQHPSLRRQPAFTDTKWQAMQSYGRNRILRGCKRERDRSALKQASARSTYCVMQRSGRPSETALGPNVLFNTGDEERRGWGWPATDGADVGDLTGYIDPAGWSGLRCCLENGEGERGTRREPPEGPPHASLRCQYRALGRFRWATREMSDGGVGGWGVVPRTQGVVGEGARGSAGLDPRPPQKKNTREGNWEVPVNRKAQH